MDIFGTYIFVIHEYNHCIEKYTMNITSSAQSVIPMLHVAEEYLGSQQLDLALSQARTILESDPTNFYAQTIERRLARILSVYPIAVITGKRGHSPIQKAIAALQHICRLGVRQLENIPEQASIHDLNQQLREKALAKKHISMLHRAHQSYHMREYQRALCECKRALIIKPDSTEALELTEEIKKHFASSPEPDLPPVLSQTQKQGQTPPISHKQQKRVRAVNQKERADFSSDNILSCITFAEYHRTNKEYPSSMVYIEEGLEYDPTNEVLLQMKEEVERLAEENECVASSEYQIA